MKRTFTRSLALSLVIGALGLPAGAQTQAKTNLVVWFPSSGNLDSAARFKFNSEFEARHPTVKVVETPQPNDNWDELFKAANLARNGPDVVMLWPGTPTTDYASYLLPLDKYLDKPYLDSLSGWELAKVGFKSSGATMGIPSSGYVYCFWYNKAIMAKIGFDGSNPPKSYDEFLALCGMLKAKGITPVVTGTKDGYIAQWGVGCLAASLMGPGGGGLVSDLSYKFAGSPVQKATELWQELAKRGYLNKNATSLSTGDEMDREFVNGGGAMLLSGNWEYKALGEAMKDNLGFFLFPSVDPKGEFHDYNYAGPTVNSCVTSYSKNKDLAVAYVKEFAVDKARIIGAAEETGDLPLLKGINSSQITNPLIRSFADVLAQGRTAVILDLIPLNAYNEFVRMGSPITMGKMSPKAAMDLIQSEVDKLKLKKK